jgi:hypothetical protein
MTSLPQSKLQEKKLEGLNSYRNRKCKAIIKREQARRNYWSEKKESRKKLNSRLLDWGYSNALAIISRIHGEIDHKNHHQSIVRSMGANGLPSATTSLVTAQVCSSKVLCVITNPQVHFAKRLMKANSGSPDPPTQESSFSTWSSTVPPSATTDLDRIPVTAQMCASKTLRVITKPQSHFAKSLLKLDSGSPDPPTQESSFKSWSITASGAFTGLLRVGSG